jgi:hypothetical protein
LPKIGRKNKTMADGETAKDDEVAASSSQEPKDHVAKIQEDKELGDVIVESGEPIDSPDQNDVDTEMTAADEEETTSAVAIAVASSSSNATGESSSALKRPADNDTNNEQGDETAEDAVATLPVDDGPTKAPPPPAPPVVVDITKPVKRARTAYFIFTDDKRSEVQDKVSRFMVLAAFFYQSVDDECIKTNGME